MSSPPKDLLLYVLVPPSPLFAAHWSFYLPDFDHSERQERQVGRRIHVSGDRLHGFKLEVVRNYDVKADRRVGSRRFPIALIPGHFLKPGRSSSQSTDANSKDVDEGGGYVDNVPVDAFEEICVGVEAPGPSLNSVSMKVRKNDVKDCQWWVREVVHALVQQEMLAPVPDKMGGEGRTPMEMVARLPVH